jgi:hypothetical protein
MHDVRMMMVVGGWNLEAKLNRAGMQLPLSYTDAGFFYIYSDPLKDRSIMR